MNQDTENKLKQENQALLKQLERERGSRKKAEEMLRTKTVELMELSTYLVNMTKRLKLALWAGNEVVWEYMIDENYFYLYKDMSEMNANIAKSGTYEEIMLGYHEDDRAHANQQWLLHEAGKISEIDFVARIRNIEKDTFRWTLVRGKRIFDEKSGTPTKVIGIFRDIHEKYLQEISYKILNSAFIQSPVPSFVIDYSLKRAEVTHSFYKIINKEHHTFSAESIYKMLPISNIKRNQLARKLRFSDVISFEGQDHKVEFLIQEVDNEHNTEDCLRYCVASIVLVSH